MAIEAKANGMLIYGWVFRDDDINSLSLFNTTKSIDMFRKAVLEMEIDGIITEYKSKFKADPLMLLKHMHKLSRERTPTSLN